ncbi:MAG: tetratricopeptide repeat protein, partial [Sulfobacillus sp.]
LVSQLQFIGSGCVQSGVKVLSTGHRTLPSSLIEVLPAGQCASVTILPMTPDETRALLENGGMPPALLTEEYISAVTAIYSGHPTLLAAVTRSLRNQGWTRESLIEVLFDRSPLNSERQEAVRRLTLLVKDDAAIEMLYRLAAVKRAFTRSEVDVVAAVEPSIGRPGEALGYLLGPWIQQISSSRFQLSPLLTNACEGLLPQRVRDVQRAIAVKLLASQTVFIDDVVLSCVQMSEIADWQLFGIFITCLLISMRSVVAAKVSTSLLLLFPQGHWPEDIGDPNKLLVRTLQVRIGRLAGENVDQQDGDLEALLSQVSMDEPAIAMAALMAQLNAGPFLKEEPSTIAVRRALAALRTLLQPTSTDLGVPSIPNIWDILWFPIVGVADKLEVRGVIKVIETLQDSEWQSLFASEIATESALILANRSWMAEADVLESERDWPAVISVLEQLEALGRERNCDLLVAGSLQAKAITLADYIDQPAQALKLLEESRALTVPGTFMLGYARARILDDLGDLEKAIDQYSTALKGSAGVLPFYHLSAYVFRGVAEARANKLGSATQTFIKGLRFVKSGVNFRSVTSVVKQSQSNDFVQILPWQTVVELTGELGIVYYLAGHTKKAADAFYAALTYLSRHCNLSDSKWRELYRKSGHAIGWFSSVADTGKGPELTADGSAYSAPEPGLISRPNRKIADLDSPPISTMWAQVGMLAQGVGLFRMALSCYLRAKFEAESKEYVGIVQFASLQATPIATLVGDFPQALQLAVQAAKALGAYDRALGGLTQVVSKDDVERGWAALSEEVRRKRQADIMYSLVILPAAVRMAESGSTEEITRLEAAFDLEQGQIEDMNYWRQILDALMTAMRSRDYREVWEKSQSLDGSDGRLCIYYLLIGRIPGVPLDRVAQTQSVVFKFVIKSLSNSIVVRQLACYIVEYWTKVSRARPFSLLVLRKTMQKIGRERGIKEACKCLFAASVATRGRLPVEVQQEFAEISGESLENFEY